MANNEPDWQSDDQKLLDIELENISLEKNIEMKGGIIEKNEAIDPRIHNAFLKNIHAFEEMDSQPKESIRSLFPPDFDFPKLESMTKKQLSRKLDDILEVLESNSIDVALVGDCPDNVIYTYLITEIIPCEESFPANEIGFRQVFDGCSGYCPDCFQKPYCSECEEIGWDEAEKP